MKKPIISVERLAEVCKIAWGEPWAAKLAAALSIEAERKVAPTQVHQWTSGARPVPMWVAMSLPGVMLRRRNELREQCLAVHGLVADLDREVFFPAMLPVPSKPRPAEGPDPHVDDEPAPRF